MTRTLAELRYAERVAALLAGLGVLDPAAAVAAHAAYVAQAEAWGMTASRCASNVVERMTGRRS